MGKTKPQQSRLAAILAENKKRTTKKSSHTKLRDDVDEEVELSAVQMMEKYQGSQDHGDKRKLRKRLEDVRGDKPLCCCCYTRHLVGCCLIVLILMGVAGVIIALKWSDVKKMWDDA